MVDEIQHADEEERGCPLLDPAEDRLVVHPIRHYDVWDFYKKALSSIWVVEEMDLSKDLDHWNNVLKDSERTFISYILAFFAASDGIVNMNILERISNKIRMLEAKFFYSLQVVMENIHSEAYSLIIETYIPNMEEREFLFSAIETIPSVRMKAEWAMKWIRDDNINLATRLTAFAAVEGIFFSSSFAGIFWIKKRGILPGLTFSNELISRDEAVHCDFACFLLNTYLKGKCKDTVEIIKEAVAVEKNFVTESLPVSLIGMNCNLMCEYVEFVADRLLVCLDEEKVYNTKNPFDFMENISLIGKTNFFDKRESQYQKAFVGIENGNDPFRTDADF